MKKKEIIIKKKPFNVREYFNERNVSLAPPHT